MLIKLLDCQIPRSDNEITHTLFHQQTCGTALGTRDLTGKFYLAQQVQIASALAVEGLLVSCRGQAGDASPHFEGMLREHKLRNGEG